MKFRKRPVVIEAMQFDGQVTIGLANWLSGTRTTPAAEWKHDAKAGTIAIRTLEGVMVANVGDWIICGVKGEFYPCKPDIFAATYESVADDLPPAGSPR